jgi:hypothetical protein
MIVDDNEDSTLLDLFFLPAKLTSSLVRPHVPACHSIQTFGSRPRFADIRSVNKKFKWDSCPNTRSKMILMMPLPGFSLPQKPCPRLQHQKMKSARFLSPPFNVRASIYPITKETRSCERIFLKFLFSICFLSLTHLFLHLFLLLF